MIKKALLTVAIIGLISTIYIVCIDYCSKVPIRLTWINDRLNEQSVSNNTKEVSSDAITANEKITYSEVGVEITGITYGETLTKEQMINITNQMIRALSHEEDCSMICRLFHENLVNIEFVDIENGLEIVAEGRNSDVKYEFKLKNQKSINQNSYYHLKLIAKDDIKLIDNLKAHVDKLFKSWDIDTKQSIYFKGKAEGKLDKFGSENIKSNVFKQLNASQTNYYSDSNMQSTCSYYAYSPYIDEYYIESDGHRTNTQYAFSYDEIKNETSVIVAFPFYNGLF